MFIKLNKYKLKAYHDRQHSTIMLLLGDSADGERATIVLCPRTHPTVTIYEYTVVCSDVEHYPDKYKYLFSLLGEFINFNV